MLKLRAGYLCGGALALLVTLAASAQKQSEPVFPSAPFNKAETSARLEPGKSTLKGFVREKRYNARNTFNGIRVSLFPCTPYFEEYYELRKRYRGNDKVAAMDGEAFTYRVETFADDNDGSFEFQNLKPGKYFLTCNVTVGKKKDYLIQTGTEYRTNMTGLDRGNPIHTSEAVPIYKPYAYFYTDGSEKKEFAEIQSDGQVVEVEL